MFEVGKIYSAQDSFHQEYFLFVLKLSKGGSALYGAVYDRSYGLVARRWCRVSCRSCCTGKSFTCSYFAYSGSFVWDSQNSIFLSCFPPEEVLDYFRYEKPALQQF